MMQRAQTYKKNVAKFVEDVSCVKSFFSLANDTKQTKSIINNAYTCTYKYIGESNSEKNKLLLNQTSLILFSIA